VEIGDGLWPGKKFRPVSSHDWAICRACIQITFWAHTQTVQAQASPSYLADCH